jgi:hypothetical protein
MLYPKCTYPALNLNIVTYMYVYAMNLDAVAYIYVSGTEPGC